jgi:hypothetical protein
MKCQIAFSMTAKLEAMHKRTRELNLRQFERRASSDAAKAAVSETINQVAGRTDENMKQRCDESVRRLGVGEKPRVVNEELALFGTVP